MDAENTMFLRIEAYLGDQMSESERTSFEQEMKEDATLAEEVRLQRDTHALLQLQAQTAYKGILQAYDQELEAGQQEAKVRSLRPMWKQTWFRAVAGIAFLLVVGYTLAYFRLNTQAISEDSFYAYANVTNVRHTDQQLNELISKGMQAYTTEDYPAAISWLSQLPPDPERPQLQLYLGISYLAEGKADEAKQAFLPLTQSDSALTETAEWYLTLAQLRLGEIAPAQQSLQQMIVAEPAHSYRIQAQQLSERLKHPLRRWLGIP